MAEEQSGDSNFVSSLGQIGAKSLSSLLSGVINYSYQKKLNQQVADLNLRNQRATMSDSDRYQRAYARDQYKIFRDSLTQANMNPYVMSGAQASGGSENLQTGSGAGSSSSPSVNFGDFGFQQALGLKMAQESHQQQIQNAQAEEDLTRAKTNKLEGSDTDLTKAEIKRIASQLKLDEAQVKLIEKQTLQLEKSELAKKLGENPTIFDWANFIVDKVPTVARDVAIAVGSFMILGAPARAAGRILLNIAKKGVSLSMKGDLKSTLETILRDKDIMDKNIDQQVVVDLKKLFEKKFGLK